MNQATYSAISGCLAHEKRFEAITNNLANVNTTGFKRDRVCFENFWPKPTATDFTQGGLEFTENELDVAIAGQGFFKVQTPQGIRFTRKGNFSLNTEGTLVTSDGFPVSGKQGAITIRGGGAVTIDKSGNISCDGAHQGQLEVVSFPDYSILQKEGSCLFKLKGPVETGGLSDGQYAISQGYLEISNVNAVKEMVQMIDCLRAYEAYQKIIQNLEEIDTQAITQLGRLA